MLKSKDIELYKTWSEYTDEEKKLLPPLDPELIKNGNVNYMWNGKQWGYILED